MTLGPAGFVLDQSPPPPSDYVPLQDGLLVQDALKVERTEVNGLKASVQNELGDGAPDGRRLLEPVATEARGEVHVVHQRVRAHHRVLIERVVVIESRPRSRHLGEGNVGELH